MEDTLFIEIQRLCQMVHERGLRELSISRPAFSISLTARQLGGTPVVYRPVYAPTSVEHPAAPAAEAAVPSGHAVTTPIIGTFYRSPSPESPPFVEIGDTVEAGQTIGIVEAMKVFNEIISDVSGTVIAIPADNGKLVKVDEPLVIISPLT